MRQQRAPHGMRPNPPSNTSTNPDTGPNPNPTACALALVVPHLDVLQPRALGMQRALQFRDLMSLPRVRIKGRVGDNDAGGVMVMPCQPCHVCSVGVGLGITIPDFTLDCLQQGRSVPIWAMLYASAHLGHGHLYEYGPFLKGSRTLNPSGFVTVHGAIRFSRN